MDRRDFLKSSGAVLAGLAVNPDPAAAMTTVAEGASQAEPRGGQEGQRSGQEEQRSAQGEQPAAKAQPAAKEGRLVLSLNQNWWFSAQRTAGDTRRDFDDSGFELVTVPHTNRRLPWHGFDDKSYEFVSVYRRRFKVPRAGRGRHAFVDFAGSMTASTVWLNGAKLGEYRGGYTPFSFELTPHLDWDHENVLVVELDSSERADIPPFGGDIDYLTFGGIYRDVTLRLVAPTYLENIFARPRLGSNAALTEQPAVDVSCFVARLERQASPLILEVELRDGDRVLAKASKTLAPAAASARPEKHELELANFGAVEPWDLEKPYLYTVVARIRRGDSLVDEDRRRIGFREARFTEHGFELNGKVVKLRGLNRHQTFPFVGQAMPERVQRRDAAILKKELKCNIVRTSHYPQSPHFLDACDELGLLVLEEIPGWQHVGDQKWQDLAVDNVRRMIERDWNHTAIVLWGVRINESRDNHDFYTRTNELARSLDPTRPTGGIRYLYDSEFLEDVFTMNDFGFPLRPPNHPLYLNTEFIGHTYVTKMNDNAERLTEHTLRHARVHNQLGSNPQYAGGIGWCAFDYNTHNNFGSGERVCYHGVMDIFRMPKPAAGFYKSQCDPDEEIVLEPAFDWSARGDLTSSLANAVVCSNCDHLKFYAGEKLIAEADPDRENFGHLPHPPFQLNLMRGRPPWDDLRIDGYLGGKKVVEKKYSSRGVDRQFLAVADDSTLLADGADATRVTLRVADEHGAPRRYSTAAITFSIEGPAEIIGDSPFSLAGGCGAVWVRAKHQPGSVILKATHPVLGTREMEFRIVPAEAGL